MKTIKVTQTKSASHRLKNHKLSLQGLGLLRIGRTVEAQDTPSTRGMFNEVHYMVSVEEEAMTLRFNTIAPAEGAKRDNLGAGRGIGSGLGKAGGRGVKGQNSRK